MAARNNVVGYFATIKDLSLTPEQESELESLIPETKRICRAIARTSNNRYIECDDLVQIALVKMAKAMKSSNTPKDVYYYKKVIAITCINQLRLERARGAYYRHLGLDSIPELSVSTDEDRLHQRLYTDTLLNTLSPMSRQILTHYYGIDTPAIGPLAISEILPLSDDAITSRRRRAESSIRTRIEKGELPTWEM